MLSDVAEIELFTNYCDFVSRVMICLHFVGRVCLVMFGVGKVDNVVPSLRLLGIKIAIHRVKFVSSADCKTRLYIPGELDRPEFHFIFYNFGKLILYT